MTNLSLSESFHIFAKIVFGSWRYLKSGNFYQTLDLLKMVWTLLAEIRPLFSGSNLTNISAYLSSTCACHVSGHMGSPCLIRNSWELNVLFRNQVVGQRVWDLRSFELGFQLRTEGDSYLHGDEVHRYDKFSQI